MLNEYDVMKAEAEQKSDAARQLMDNPTLLAAFESLEQTYIAGWRSTAENDAAGRERHYVKLTLLRELQADLAATIAAGKMVLVNHRSQLTR